jgi:hypothetical protein
MENEKELFVILDEFFSRFDIRQMQLRVLIGQVASLLLCAFLAWAIPALARPRRPQAPTAGDSAGWECGGHGP